MRKTQTSTTVVVTGTDTGAGKTVLTSLLTRRLRGAGVNAVALKPLCSGGREDAVVLHAANGGELTMDEVNPWHFRAALAPVLAARREGREVTLAEVVARVRSFARRHEVVLVEGAGGLLSPLGEGFDTRDMVGALSAIPLIVVPDRLGAVNQTRLVWEALPKSARARARIILMGQGRKDAAAGSNLKLLKEFAPKADVFRLPWISRLAGAERQGVVAASLDELLKGLRS